MYPEPTNIWERIEYSSFGTAIAESPWMFPTFEVLHVIALLTVIGTIAVVDLRLIGAASRTHRVSLIARDMLPWTWGAFGLAAVTGGLLFVSKAHSYMINPWFLAKMSLMALAGLNMAYFHRTVWRTVGDWELNAPFPPAAQIAGWASLIFWVVIVFCARAIGFTLSIYY
jgi:hypothetical protein